MVRYWVITSHHWDRPEAFEHCWKYDRSHGVIAIGWSIGNGINMSDEELGMRYDEEFPESPRDFHQVRKFWKEIRIEDRIIARGGRKAIVGIGTVTGNCSGLRGAEWLMAEYGGWVTLGDSSPKPPKKWQLDESLG